MKNLSLYIVLSMTTLLNLGCSSHNDIISISEPHYYNNDFGLVPNDAADRQLYQELLAMNSPTQIDMVTEVNPEWSMELTKDPDAFYAHEYVQKPDVITYKYKFDEKFHKTAEWRSAEF